MSAGIRGTGPAAEGRAATGVSTAEKRYRRWLRAYPRAWRADHGEALLGTLLDVCDGRGGTGPTVGEARDLLLHGAGRRSAYLAPQRRTRDLASALAIGLGAALSSVLLLVTELWFLPVGEGLLTRTDVEGVIWPFSTFAPLLYGAWLLVLPAALLGRRSLARVLLLGCAVLAVAVLAVDAHFSASSHECVPAVSGLGGLALVGALSPPAERGARRRLGWWTVAGILLLLAETLRTVVGEHGIAGLLPVAPQHSDHRYSLAWDLSNLVVLAACAGLVGAAVVRRWRPRAFPVLALVGSGWYVVGLGPVGLLLDVGQPLIGVLTGSPVYLQGAAPWWISAGLCLAGAAVTAWVRWRVGPPVSRR